MEKRSAFQKGAFRLEKKKELSVSKKPPLHLHRYCRCRKTQRARTSLEREENMATMLGHTYFPKRQLVPTTC